jgi:hypothetical protein
MDGTRSALIVASYEYADPGLRRLRAPASDAQALAGVLQDPGIGGFEVRTLLNESSYEVNLAVEEFFADRRPDDLLLVHFSCHGVKDEDGELYFATANTVLRALGATAVAAEFVNRRMSRSRSRRVVLLLDCCYAGAFERGMTARAGAGVEIEERFGGRGRAVITASSAMEYAFEGDQLADTQELAPSVFTSAVVQGLETGEADRDQDGMVALDELYDYVYDKVQEATPNQTPGKWTFGVQGDLYIARRARPVTKPAPLPPELQEAIDSPFAAVRTAAVQELVRLLQGRHAGLGLAARLALERFTNDDSRAVADAATAALGAQAPPTAAPTTHPDAVPEMPEGARPGAQQDAAVSHASPAPVATTPPAVASVPTPTTSAGAAAAGPAAEPTLPPTGVDHHTVPQARADRRLLVAGQLAILGAALLVVGLFPNYIPPRSLWQGRDDHAEMNWFKWYLLATAILILAAGACTLAPRTRLLIGPGLLLGVVAASTWGLPFLVSYWLVFRDALRGGGWWVEFVAHLVLALAAGLAGVTLALSGKVRLTRRPPRDEPAWLVVVLGGAGALALVFYDHELWAVPGEIHGHWDHAVVLLAPSIWATALALAVPALAVLALPRRFGVALLAGWLAGGAAFFSFHFQWVTHEYGGLDSTPIIMFGVTLLALLVVTVLFARAEPSSQVEHTTRE